MSKLKSKDNRVSVQRPTTGTNSAKTDKTYFSTNRQQTIKNEDITMERNNSPGMEAPNEDGIELEQEPLVEVRRCSAHV